MLWKSLHISSLSIIELFWVQFCLDFVDWKFKVNRSIFDIFEGRVKVLENQFNIVKLVRLHLATPRISIQLRSLCALRLLIGQLRADFAQISLHHINILFKGQSLFKYSFTRCNERILRHFKDHISQSSSLLLISIRILVVCHFREHLVQFALDRFQLIQKYVLLLVDVPKFAQVFFVGARDL